MTEVEFKKALKHIAKVDPLLAHVVKAAELKYVEPASNYFERMLRAITSQQLSTKAADTIFKRLLVLIGGRVPSPKKIPLLTDEQLRSVGLSGAKVRYVRAVAEAASRGHLDKGKIEQMSDAETIAHLTAIPGVGVWSAEMFLMFAIGRPDVFSYGDLGLRKGLMKVYGLSKEPTAQQAEAITSRWKPYRTVGSRLLWASLRLE